ncbi:hypothetical protein [Psychrobacillus phage Perkons]|nr:hypothetical protein [Psychrobacillus phage Perkons]
MTKTFEWASIDILSEKVINTTNNRLTFTINGVPHEIVINQGNYTSNVGNRFSGLVNEIQAKIKLQSLNLECKMGVIVDTKKQVVAVFVHDENDTFTMDGTLLNVIGEGDIITIDDGKGVI